MKIERLMVQGFKSFGERTALDFSAGVFGIVGPNGSGKSNLVEALRWVVGARARELRGEEALSLLFQGADGKAPLGFAEVVLELSDGAKRLVLSRRLERSGEAEVRLGGARASLRQIEQALLGTGLSRSGYAVVGQGEVGQILQAGPEVLLAYLEEAAGLRAVTQASKTARERLEAALGEFQLRLAEVSEREQTLSTKAQQAQAAREAAELAARVLVLRRSLLSARILEADAEAKLVRAKAGGLEAERGEITLRLQQLEQQKLQALQGLEAAQQSYSEALRQAEQLLGEARLAQQEHDALQNLLQRLSRESSEIQARQVRLQSVGMPTHPSVEEPEATWQHATEVRLRELEATLNSEEARLRQAQQSFERYLQTQAAFEVQQVAYRQALEQAESLRAKEQQIVAQLEQVSGLLQEAQLREGQLRLQLEALLQQEAQLSSDSGAASAEARRLQALLSSGSDLAEGPRKAREAGIAGITGIVADLLEVAPQLELALETLLGARLQWVLCESESAAQAGVEYLKRQGGRATFLPRTLLKGSGRRLRDWSKEAGVLGLARELVSLPACPEAIFTLLGEALVLQTLEAALNLRRRLPDVPRMVTLEGELLEPSGAITGGRVQKGGQMLALRRRLQETQREAQGLAAQAQQIRQQSASLREELQTLGLETLHRRKTDLEAEAKALQANLSFQTSLSEPKAPARVTAPDAKGLENLRAEREALQAQRATNREAALAWSRFHDDLRRYQEAQLQIAELAGKNTQLEAEQAQLAAKLAGVLSRKSELDQAQAHLELETLQKALETARQTARALSEEESRLIARTNAIVSDLEALHLTQARREATIETLQTEFSELPPGALEKGTSRSLARLLGESEAGLEALGPVNHLAEREYTALEAEIAALRAALDEAQQAVVKLQVELDLVEAEYHQRLEAKYHLFKGKFTEYAAALLGAEVQLERLPSGLDLVLKPAGKRAISLELLSMGERTMGALAFLFALSEVGEGGGLPIAVLDEVDAPLDEANIQRFCRFLRHFSAQTQFILVTHQKRTMEACDALYGVTADKGLSQIFSIKTNSLA